MEQPGENYGLHSGNIGQFMRKVVDDWRLDQRKSIRHRLVDFEDNRENSKIAGIGLTLKNILQQCKRLATATQAASTTNTQ